MSDFQAIADRVEIEALRGEFTDAAMMRDYGRLAALFTPDGALRILGTDVDLADRDQIRAWGDRVPEVVEYFVQNTHPGVIRLDGGTASGRAYMSELIRLRDGRKLHALAQDRDEFQPSVAVEIAVEPVSPQHRFELQPGLGRRADVAAPQRPRQGLVRHRARLERSAR